MQRTFCKQCLNSLSRMRRCPRVPATPSAVCAGPLQRIFSRVAPGTRAPGLNSDHGRCFPGCSIQSMYSCARSSQNPTCRFQRCQNLRGHCTEHRSACPACSKHLARMNATQKIETSALLKEWLTTMKHQCYAGAFSKDGQRVFSGGCDNKVQHAIAHCEEILMSRTIL